MSKPHLALPADVIRKVDPDLDPSNLDIDPSTEAEHAQTITSQNAHNQILSRIEGVESKLAGEHSGYYKTYYAGVPENKDTWVTPEDIVWRKNGRFWRIFVNLPHQNILPYDETKGDEFQIRDGPKDDDFQKVESDEFSIDQNTGTLSINFLVTPWFVYNSHPGNDFRATYRYGAQGGDHSRAGQTTVTGGGSNTALTSGTSTGDQDLGDETQLPRGNHLFVINEEYVRGSINNGQGTISITERGVRGTTASSHADGDILHYCPVDVRESVAAKAAREVVLYSDVIDEIAGDNIEPQTKLEEWEREWKDLVASSAGWSSV